MKNLNQILLRLNLVHKHSRELTFQFNNEEPTARERMFKPDFTPIEMFYLGIFEGNYFKIKNTQPKCEYLQRFLDDIENQKELHFKFEDNLHNSNPNIKNNLFEVMCGSTLQQWLDKDWIMKDDPNGWVEWYVKFYYGRRQNYVDNKQIGRWLSFKARHSGMLLKWCKPEELDKCAKTRQNLLHWAIDSTKIGK